MGRRPGKTFDLYRHHSLLIRFMVKRIFPWTPGGKHSRSAQHLKSSGAFPQSQKPAQAGFCGVAPLASNIPGAGDCQGPPSAHTGRLALALTGTGRRYTSPLGGQHLFLPCAPVVTADSLLRLYAPFNTASDLLAHFLNFVQSIASFGAIVTVIQCGNL